MFYSDLVRKACSIMFDAHKGDMDKSGYPYVFHPFYLASQMDDEVSVCAALLHDVIEDHGDKYSFEYLEGEGFTEEMISALKLLTHDRDVPYMDYVKKIAENPTATKIKLADLEHNLDLSRLGDAPLPPKYETYLQARAFLQSIRK